MVNIVECLSAKDIQSKSGHKDSKKRPMILHVCRWFEKVVLPKEYDF